MIMMIMMMLMVMMIMMIIMIMLIMMKTSQGRKEGEGRRPEVTSVTVNLSH